MTTAGDGELAGRAILVTGGAANLGFEISKTLLAAGAQVVITGRDVSRGEAAAAELGDGAQFLRQDALHEADWTRVLGEVERRLGRLDGLVNNVGGPANMAPIPEISPARFREICDWNIRGTLLGLKHGYLAMRGAPGGGSIVNIASIAALYVVPIACGYCAGKAVLPALARGAAEEFASAGVRVNTLYPGVITNEATERNFEVKGNRDAYMASVPMRRLADMDEFGALALYLLSDRSRHVTGADFVADGGKTVL